MKLSKPLFILGVLIVAILSFAVGSSAVSGYGNYDALTTGVVVAENRKKFFTDLLNRFDWNKFNWETFPWDKYEDFPWEKLPWDKLPDSFDLNRLPWDKIPDIFEDFPYDKVPWDKFENMSENILWENIVDKLPDTFDWENFDWNNLPEDFDYSKLPWDNLPENFDYGKLPWDKMRPEDFDKIPWDEIPKDRIPWDRIPWNDLPEDFDYGRFPWDEMTEGDLSNIPWDNLPEDFDYGQLPWDKMTEGDLSNIPWDKLPEDFDYGQLPWDKMTEQDLAEFPWDKLPEDFDYGQLPWDKLPADFDYGQLPWDKMTEDDLANIPWDRVPPESIPWGSVPLDKLPDDFPWASMPWGSLGPDFDYSQIPWDSLTKDNWNELPDDFPWWLAVGGLIVAGQASGQTTPPKNMPDNLIPQESFPPQFLEQVPPEWRSKFESTAPSHNHVYGKVIEVLEANTCGTYGSVRQACTVSGCTATRIQATAPTNQHHYDAQRYCSVCHLYCLSVTGTSAQKFYDGTPLTSDTYEIDYTLSAPRIAQLDVRVSGFGKLVTPGKMENYLKISVFDGDEDVTKEFYIDMHPGSLTVKARPLHIDINQLRLSAAELAEKYGGELTGEDIGYTIRTGDDEGLLDGHRLEIVFSDADVYTESGFFEVEPISVKVYDSVSGADVSAYYKLEVTPGSVFIR